MEILEDLLDAPIPSIRENQLLPVKGPRLKPAHVSVSDKTFSGLSIQDEGCAAYDTLSVERS